MRFDNGVCVSLSTFVCGQLTITLHICLFMLILPPSRTWYPDHRSCDRDLYVSGSQTVAHAEFWHGANALFSPFFAVVK